MPDFPVTPTTRIIGPAQAVIIVVAEGVTDAPLQILNDDEEGVAEIGVNGLLRTIAGAFTYRGPSITDEVEVTS